MWLKWGFCLKHSELYVIIALSKKYWRFYMKSKYLFSALAASAVIVAPVAVEQAAASTVSVDFSKFLDFELPANQWGIDYIVDEQGNELKRSSKNNKTFLISQSNLNKYYEYHVSSSEGMTGDYIYLTGTLSNPAVLTTIGMDNSIYDVLSADSSLKVVKHTLKHTPRLKNGTLYVGGEKPGDTIEFSNGMVVKVAKDEYGWSTLKVVKTAPKPVAIVVNGKQLSVNASQSPYVANGTTMVPLRIISQTLGATVNYNANKSITLGVGNKQITISNGSKMAYVKGGATLTMSAPVIIKNGTTYVPLRFISETFGAKVEWNQANYKVTITK